MIYAVVAVALLILGAIAGRVGARLGTALAVLPAVVWFALLAHAIRAGTVDGNGGDELLVLLLVGLVAFLTGSNIASRGSRPRSSRPD